MDELNELRESVPETIKANIAKIKSKDKKEYTMSKFLDDICKSWSKLTPQDQRLLSRFTAEDFEKIINELKEGK